MRQREQDHLRLFRQQPGVGLGEPERFRFRVAGELRKNLRQRLAGILARGHGHQFRVGMMQQQPDEFLAGVTGRADDGDFLGFHIAFLFLPQRRKDAEKILQIKNPAGFASGVGKFPVRSTF